MALASPRVLQQGMLPVLIGTIAGLVSALGLTRLMTKLLFEVRAGDPATLFLTTLAIVSVATIACYIPALRAAQTDPLVSLRYE